jgi:hypothetical protein
MPAVLNALVVAGTAPPLAWVAGGLAHNGRRVAEGWAGAMTMQRPWAD